MDNYLAWYEYDIDDNIYYVYIGESLIIDVELETEAKSYCDGWNEASKKRAENYKNIKE